MVVETEPAPERLQFLRQKQGDRPKKFSTDTFLDLYMKEQNKPLTTFDEVRSFMVKEKETQMQLKEVLGIRTFDQI